MPDYKNQHYVPQFYFRGWTTNDKVPVFNIKNQEEYRPTSISNLCSEDYFYGDAEQEKATEDLEDFHARIVRKLREKMSFRILSSREIYHFCIFVLYLKNRTKRTKEEVDFLTDKLAKEVLKMQTEAGVVDPKLLEASEGFRIIHEGMHSHAMLHALTGPELILDLEPALMINNTDLEFIFCDHPVVLDNQMYKQDQTRFLDGLQNRGLQVYVPLSESLCMMLYDRGCYTVDYSNPDKRRVIVSSDETVQGLNYAQMTNAGESIFYRTKGKEEEMVDVLGQVEGDRHNDPAKFQTHKDEHDFPTENPVIESGSHMFDYEIDFPFMRKLPNVPHEIERKPGIVDSHNEHMDKILEKHQEG